jgi:hypothetical protein
LPITVDGESNKIEKNGNIEKNGKILEKRPFGFTPMTKPIEVTTPGFLFEIKIAAVLKFRIITFGLIVNNVLKVGITLGGVIVNKIVNKNIGNNQNKDVKIKSKKNDRDKNDRDKTINPRLFDKIEGEGGSIGKIADSLNGSVTFLFGFRF